LRRLLLDVFERGAAQPLPWLVDLTYWHSAQQTRGTLDARYRGEEGLVRLHEDLGCEVYYDYAYGPWDARYETAEITTSEQGHRRVCTWRCSRGSLTQEWRYLPESFCWASLDHPVRQASDLAILREIIDGRRWAPNYARYLDRQAALGERGMPCALLPRAPLAAMIAEWAGVAAMTFLIADAPAEFEETLACLRADLDRGLAVAEQSPAPLVHFGDNLSAANVAGYFARYLRDDYVKAAARLHRAGKFVAVHLDGVMRGLLDQLAATGVDAIESLTPKPVGDLEIEELRPIAGNRVILWGGLPGAMFTPPFTQADIDRQVARIRESFEERGRFIVGSADQIPPDGDIALVRRVADRLRSGR
jgi:hypothetical protein